MYRASLGESNTAVLSPSGISTESRVQVTVVAGPPVEIQVKVYAILSLLGSVFTVKVISSSTLMSPVSVVISAN